ncbi:MAG: TrkA family potassium uptake protein [Myxococcota bacterium]
MKQQVVVVGLGQFGMTVARTLAERGVEVLAADSREDRVRALSNHVAEALCFDATDQASLARISPDRRDACICAIGDEAREASIVCTALLRQLGAPRVIARANDELHARILKLVGAHEVVNPEHDFGERFASSVLHRGVIGEMVIGGGLVVTELVAPAAFTGHDLASLKLPHRHGITVVALRRKSSGEMLLPAADTRVEDDDVLVVVGREGAAARLLERS